MQLLMMCTYSCSHWQVSVIEDMNRIRDSPEVSHIQSLEVDSQESSRAKTGALSNNFMERSIFT